MPNNDDVRLLTGREFLRSVQYRTDANLAARQSIYQFQRPRLNLPQAVLGLARLTGTETVADVGCGNGMYLAELVRRGHSGHLLGVDLSAGMARAASDRTGKLAGVAAGDAAALPLADEVADVALAMHMLYHVPDRQVAARELGRVTRRDGQVLVVLNATDHLTELRELVSAAAVDVGLSPDAPWAEVRNDGLGLTLDTGYELLAAVFSTVIRHDFPATLDVPGPEPVLDYVRSMRLTQSLADSGVLVDAVARRLPAGRVTIRTHCGALICR